ncbi:MAG: iron-only hydrogenase system regulator [Armatimonadetes bacterium]|jgi:putative iron-only hydrogenase system regulator|nr:iron-only hydrogenase system regulator [Armatimonadota bacterium]MDI9583089.1 iron-only hydrogenase system regulator [Acidobacteriota bacterium]
MSKRVGVIVCIIEEPEQHSDLFNAALHGFTHLIRGRMGCPFHEHGIGVVSLTVVATVDEINELTGRLGNVPGVQAKTAISRREIDD